MQYLEKGRREIYILGWVMLVLGLVLFFFLTVFKIYLMDIMPPCMFQNVTGYYCPGCGGTRATALLLQGRLLYSFLMHPVVLYCAIIYLWFMFSTTVEGVSKGQKRVGLHYHGWFIIVGAILLILNFGIKNGAILFGYDPLWFLH